MAEKSLWTAVETWFDWPRWRLLWRRALLYRPWCSWLEVCAVGRRQSLLHSQDPGHWAVLREDAVDYRRDARPIRAQSGIVTGKQREPRCKDSGVIRCPWVEPETVFRCQNPRLSLRIETRCKWKETANVCRLRSAVEEDQRQTFRKEVRHHQRTCPDHICKLNHNKLTLV